MGAAKRKGTYEQRKAMAIERERLKAEEKTKAMAKEALKDNSDGRIRPVSRNRRSASLFATMAVGLMASQDGK